jgi:hypothetical protein
MIRRVERKKTGRPSKGPREHANIQLPPELKAAAKRRAAERGVTFTDLVGLLLEQETGVPYQIQEGLPLTKAS